MSEALDIIGLRISLLADGMADTPGEWLPEPILKELSAILPLLQKEIPGLEPPRDRGTAEFHRRLAQKNIEQGEVYEALRQSFRGLVASPLNPQLWYLVASSCLELCEDIDLPIMLLLHVLWIYPGHTGARADVEALTAFLDDSKDE